MRLLIALGMLLAIFSSAAADSYNISGRTVEELVAAVSKSGHEDGWGSTRAKHVWNYVLDRSIGPCKVTSVTVTETIIITLPVWTDKANAKSCLQDNWDKMIEKLKAHEEHHRAIWGPTKENIRKALTNRVAGCSKIEAIIKNVAQAEIAKIEMLQKKYDEDTDHGKKEGIILSSC